MYRRYYAHRPKKKGLNIYNIENYQSLLTFPNKNWKVDISIAVSIIPANNSVGMCKITQLRGSFTTNYQGNMLVAVI